MLQSENIEQDRTKWDHNNPTPIVVTCSNCGTAGVTRDAVVRWDIQTQKWELSGIFDNSDCDICGQVSLDDTPIKEYFGDMCGEEILPDGIHTIMAVAFPNNLFLGKAFENQKEIYIHHEKHPSATEAKNAVRTWLLEQGKI